jgi:RHS repeat-associated protein
MVVAVSASLLSAVPAQADANARFTSVDRDRVIKGHKVRVKPRKIDDAVKNPAPVAKVAWPKPGFADVTIPGQPAGSVQSGKKTNTSPASTAGTKAGSLPVWVAPPGQGSGSGKNTKAQQIAGKVRVRVLDRKTTRRAGIEGLLFTIGRLDTGAGPAAVPGKVGVRLDYSAFQQAYGGTYGSRLRLVQLPACVLTTPSKAECRKAALLVTRNNTESKTLAADVGAAPATAATATASGVSSATVLAAVAGESSDKGDYKATSLSASASWKVNAQSGDFAWSYPMGVPKVPGGLVPQVGIGYSSGSVDGSTSSTNNQGAWVGQGFDLWPGFIERRFKSCKDDGAPKGEWGNFPGDLCWGYDNATMSLNGKGGELIPVGNDRWRLRNDDGTRIEKLTGNGTDTANGDNDNEYWKVTTPDGIRYYFGKSRLDHWVAGKPETKSTWTAPVFGDDDGEPCNKSSFADSWCQQAYRWNLDYVVDPRGNAITYYYDPETNYYGRNLKAEDETSYERGGTLNHIEYGLRSDNLFPANAPARVDFTTSERCIRDAASDCDPANITDHSEYWEDVPWDLHCNSGQDCKDGHGGLSPTFWSRKRLTQVSAKILKADGSGYRPVDTWKLDHSWGMADVDRALLLEKITHTGEAAAGPGAAAATPVTLPPMTFVYTQLPNRVDKLGDDVGPFVKYRLGTVYNETGGQLDVNYSGQDCTTEDLPTPQTNHRRCFPAYWTKTSGDENPTRDWFHKYVVTDTVQTDLTAGSPTMITKYDYSIGQPAWHFDDDDGLTPEKYKTWSQWRGYDKVRVKTGGTSGMVSQTDHWYFQGMDGDRADTSGDTSKTVKVSDGEGGIYDDHSSLAGSEVRTVTYDKVDGNVVTKTVKSPWHHQTASRTRSWGTVTANLTGDKTTRTLTALDDGAWRETRTTTNTFDTTTGAALEVDDFGDWDKSDDDRCTTTDYAIDTTAWLLTYPSQVKTVAKKCADTPDLSKDLVSDVRTYYDGGAFDAAPTKWESTRSEKAKEATSSTVTSYLTAGTATFDYYGRPLTITDTASNTTTTAYTDTQGLTTKIVITTPPAKAGDATTALTTTQVIDPAWGKPTKETDAGGKSTNIAYDALGRTSKVWLADRTTSMVPTREFSYTMAKNAIVAVVTKDLTNADGQDISYALLDGWLRPRQSQTRGPDGGRLITDTFYNAIGKVDRTYATYFAGGAPDTTLFGLDVPGDVETQDVYTYDGLGRTTADRLLIGNSDANEKWRTTYAYGGDWTTVTPPAGGTPTTTITDAHGRTVEKRQHWTAAGPAGYSSTKYVYNPLGQLASVTAPGSQTWTYTYDLRGRKTQSGDPDTGTTTYTYNDLDQLTQTEDARHSKIGITYDGLGRKTATYDATSASPGTKLAEWTYDLTGALRKGQLITSTRYVGADAYTTKIASFDPLNRPTSTTIKLPTSEGALAPVNGYTFGTPYNADGTPQMLSIPAAGGLGAENVSFTYDADDLGRLTKTTSNLSAYVTDTRYSKTGKLLKQDLATSKTTHLDYTYEFGTQRLKTASTVRDGAQTADRKATYDYHDAGNLKQITDVASDGIDNQCFKYDYLQRLTDAWAEGTTTGCAADPATAALGGPAPYRVNYAYDVTGNRKTETQYGDGGLVTATRDYKYAADAGVDGSVKGHQLSAVTQSGTGAKNETYIYDASGHTKQRTIGGTTQTLTWDNEGELTKVADQAQGDTSYVYTPEGDRLIRRDPTGTTLYLPGMEVRLDKGATTPKATRYYSHGGQTVAMRDSSGVTFFASDHHGTAELAINATTGTVTRRRFTPFGQTRGTPAGTWLGEKGFVGGTIDASTDLTHLGAREYDPDTGRFISADPLTDLNDPQQLNGYAYGNNSPITSSDPTGLMTDGPRSVGTPCSVNPKACGDDDDWKPAETGSDTSGTPGAPGGSPAACTSTWCKFRRLAAAPTAWVVGTVAFAVCNGGADPFTAGAAAIPCTIGSVALGSAVNNLIDPDADHSFEGVAKQATVDLAITAATAAVGPIVKAAIPARFLNLKVLKSLVRGNAGSRPTASVSHSKANPGCSFIPGTKVLLANGRYKPINQIKSGDKVLASNPATGKTAARVVTATIVGASTKHLAKVTIDADGDKGHKTGSVTATDNHPFWAIDGIRSSWKDAGQLKPGMWLRTSAGTFVQIAAIKAWTQYQLVYNLTVDTDHTYYVEAGTTPVLVHNSGPCGPDLSINAGQFGKKWGKHAQDYGLNPGDPESRQWFLSRTNEVRNSHDEVRQGPWNPQGGGGDDHFFYRKGSDLLITKNDGEFVTMFPMSRPNGWHEKATPFSCGCG